MAARVNVSVLICSHGEMKWEELGRQRAGPSAEAQDPHEIIHHHRVSATLAEVRNEAAEQAAGEWLCFVDADDELAPGYLAAMSQRWMEGATTQDWAPLLVPAVQYVREASRPGFAAHESEPCIPDWGRPLIQINCAVIGTLVRRSLFLAAGGFAEWPLYEDWDLWLRCHYRHGAPLVDVCDAVYRAHVGVGGRNAGANAVDAYQRIRDQYLREGIT